MEGCIREGRAILDNDRRSARAGPASNKMRKAAKHLRQLLDLQTRTLDRISLIKIAVERESRAAEVLKELVKGVRNVGMAIAYVERRRDRKVWQRHQQ